MRLEKGCIQVYTGDGKGKTTSALGLALRASGHGFKTLIIQFMKGKTGYGELKAIENIPQIELIQFGTDDFVFKGQESKIDYAEAEAAVSKAVKAMSRPDLSILNLDEVNVALHFGLIPVDKILELIKKKPEHLEMILTGRRAPAEIIELADLVTNFEEKKHYYRTLKLEGRKGIEY